LHQDGTFTYTPDADKAHQAAADTATQADKQDTFTATVTDGHGGTATAEVTVDITPTNQTPTIRNDSRVDLSTGIVTGTAGSDADGDTLVVTITSAPT